MVQKRGTWVTGEEVGNIHGKGRGDGGGREHGRGPRMDIKGPWCSAGHKAGQGLLAASAEFVGEFVHPILIQVPTIYPYNT